MDGAREWGNPTARPCAHQVADVAANANLVAVKFGMKPSAQIEELCRGHADILTTVSRLTGDGLEERSLLPGWTRAHVVAHLAHKSRAHVGVFLGAAKGEVANQYPDGRGKAEAETKEWSLLPGQDLYHLLASAFSSLEGSWAALADSQWNRRGISSAGERSMMEFIDRHMRDVYVHHVDLNAGYEPSDWPTAFVDAELPKRLRDLPARAPAASLLAWLLGRASAPDLSAW